MKVSKIGWTDFSGGSLNFANGCTPISAGCNHCYARALDRRFSKEIPRVIVRPDNLETLRRTNFPKHSPKRGVGHKPMAFVCDMSDLFHKDVPDEIIERAFSIMGERWDVNWQVLTKRAGRMRNMVRRMCEESYLAHISENIWLGVSAENQEMAVERIPTLLDTPAAVRFVSVEPMLGPVSLWRSVEGRYPAQYLHDTLCGETPSPRIDWVICGAESGPNRRPFDEAWAESLYEECKHFGIPFFGKQDSGFRPGVPLILPQYGEVKEWPLPRQNALDMAHHLLMQAE